MYGQGISREGNLLDVAVDMDIIKKSGAWFTYEGEQLGQGRENAKVFLRENVDLVMEIDAKVRAAVGFDAEAEAAARELAAENASGPIEKQGKKKSAAAKAEEKMKANKAAAAEASKVKKPSAAASAAAKADTKSSQPTSS